MSDSDNREAWFMGFVMAFIAAVGFILGCAFASSQETAHWRTEAVKRGHAEWLVKPNGETEFRWKGDAP